MSKIQTALLVVCLAVLIPAQAQAKPRKVARDFDRVAPGATVDVIVQFTVAPPDRQRHKIERRGGRHKRSLPLIRAGVYSLSLSEVKILSNDPDIAYISPDRPVMASLDYAHPAVGAGIARSYGWTGNGIGVAVIDSGILAVSDLEGTNHAKSQVVYSESFVGSSAQDAYGHGTHVAGILAGNGKKSTGPAHTRTFLGVAPDVKLLNLKVLDDHGAGTDSAVIAAIERAIQLKEAYNIRVMNLSLGRPVFESYAVDPLCQAVERAWKAGIVVVVAAGNWGRDNSAGNDGYATIASPGNDPYVITVGAMKTMGSASREDDQIATYSSKGPTAIDHYLKPDLVAPGNRIVSLTEAVTALYRQSSANLVPLSYYNRGGGAGYSPKYFRLSGTSMAAPMVSGAAALLLEKQPSLTPDGVKARLMRSAAKTFPAQSVTTDPATGETFTSQYDVFTAGAGYLDIWAALNDTETSTGAALSPRAAYEEASGTVRLLCDSGAAWGSDAVWGTCATGAVWGTDVFLSGTGAVRGTGAVWGTQSATGFGAVWGTGAVWGSGAVWGTNSLQGLAISLNGEN
ncbi:MAG: S8 family peptidase [Bryobacteraceae bacterium]|nr:S8 family peptidase [Bryobacteraceae bacterium]